MNEERSRIEVIKEKMDQNKIALEIFGNKEGCFSFLDSVGSKNKLRMVYDIAYNNITQRFNANIDDSYNNALNKLNSKLSELHILNNEYLSFFVFGKKAYEISLPYFLLLKKHKEITNNLQGQDILIYSPSIKFGACLLVDEHFISVSHWD